jgi:DTW domain-containing protein YfiP
MQSMLCICALVPRIETRTRLVLVMHRTEERKTTNTGRLAAHCLPNSEVWIRGRANEPAAAIDLDARSQSVLLFPHEDAVPITRFANAPRPVTLIVPDGTWRQASRVRQRIPGLREVPCVSIPPDAPSEYRLRHESHREGLATLEAIARAFGILEGPHVRAAMEHVLRVMVERTLWSRGVLRAEDVTGGVPAAALARAAGTLSPLR